MKNKRDFVYTALLGVIGNCFYTLVMTYTKKALKDSYITKIDWVNNVYIKSNISKL